MAFVDRLLGYAILFVGIVVTGIAAAYAVQVSPNLHVLAALPFGVFSVAVGTQSIRRH